MRKQHFRHLCLEITIVLLLAVIAPSPFAEDKPAMPEFDHYMIRLHPVRAEMPFNMTEHEQQVMGEHFGYLKKLTQQGIVQLAGPVFGDPVFGLVVAKVSSKEAAEEIAKNDPSVIKGVNTYDVAGMFNSLMAHNVPTYRYADSVTERVVRKDVVVPGKRADVYKLWTTTEGLRAWFTPYSSIDLRVGGKFEILFSMDAPEGQRGSEGCRILSYLPGEMLSFEWNAPPSLGEMRYLHHFIVLQFEQATPDSVRVELTELGFGSGEGWDAVYQYFDSAWGRVMANFEAFVKKTPLPN